MNIELPLDGTERKRVRPVSKALFHSAYALEAYVFMAQEARFYKAQLAEATGCKPNYAGRFFDRLEDDRVIERLPQEDGQLRQYYRKVPSPIWGELVSLAEALLDEPDSKVTPFPTRG